MTKQTKHLRKSKKGKLFRAGRRLFPIAKKRYSSGRVYYKDARMGSKGQFIMVPDYDSDLSDKEKVRKGRLDTKIFLQTYGSAGDSDYNKDLWRFKEIQRLKDSIDEGQRELIVEENYSMPNKKEYAELSNRYKALDAETDKLIDKWGKKIIDEGYN